MFKEDKLTRMNKLVDILNRASSSYYGEGESSLSDGRYDKLLKELITLELETKTILPNSPTNKVGYEDSDAKYKHRLPVLSLKDTKSIDELLYFIGENEGVLSWKLDGMTIVLYYEGGALTRALSRGDGNMGKDITKNVVLMRGVPLKVDVKGPLIVRGEGVLSIKDFEQIKRTKEGEKYSNPRNLACGLINSTKTTGTLLRFLNFVAHDVTYISDDNGQRKTYLDDLRYLEKRGFDVVNHQPVLNFQLKGLIPDYTKTIEEYPYPVDGLVLRLNDLELGDSLGSTAKYPKHSMAFKWPDEHKLTKVLGMTWSVSRTGLLTPVVIFEPIELEGTTVQRANLHNLKFFQGLDIGKGDTIEVFKANKITPEVRENLTRSGTETYPDICPKCESPTEVFTNERTKKLYCKGCKL